MIRHSATRIGCPASRRGVLLLIVLSMLSLFMMLGVAYVVMASRARDASRGFAKVIAPSGESQLPVAQLLDSAAMLVIRGTATSGTTPTALATGGPTFRFESLLEDQYGTANVMTGDVEGFLDKSPLCSVSVSFNSAPPTAVELCGRILTFLPSQGKASSHRILRATEGSIANGASHTLWIANVGGAFGKSAAKQGQPASYNFPPKGTDFVINGRAHSGAGAALNEAWDGHDFGANPFLAQVEPLPATPSSATVVRASMFDASGATLDAANDVDSDLVPDDCDNDNDGVVDGQFFNPQFPAIAAANGNEIVTHMSCLILDLDGRLNVNAHGSIASEIYPSSHNGWPTTGGWANMPLGSGYGPAELSGTAALAAFNAQRPSPAGDSPWSSLFLGSGTGMQYTLPSQRPGEAPTPEQGCRLVPLALPDIEGRYAGRPASAPLGANTTVASLAAGAGSLPGVSGSNDLMSTYNEGQFTGVRSPIDLHGRMKSQALPPAGSAVLPTLAFAKPDASNASNEFVDDPYELILGQQKGGGVLANPQTMGTAVGAAPDNVFSIAELERVLRPYDSDSASLAPRLFALLGSQAEVARLAVTTESWDVPVITGTAAITLFGTAGWFATVDPAFVFHTTGPANATSGTIPNGVIPPDLAAGLRLDVTRTGTSDLQRRTLFKDLYTTCVALLTPPNTDPSAADAARYAQWAANVVEYQDPDSTMTQYEYDVEPRDGWNVDGDPATSPSSTESTRAVVWGAERPEVVITQTLAWEDGTDGELYVMLHRPWNSRLEIPGSAPAAAEPSDPALRASPSAPDGSIALSGTTPSGDNIWRLRVGTAAGSPIVRFDPVPVGSNDLGATAATPPAFVSQFGADSWMCIRPAGASTQSVTVPGGVPSFSVTKGPLKAPPGTTHIRLERLANPSAAYDANSNPYLVVDAAEVTVVNPTLPTTPPPEHIVRTRVGWNQQFDSTQASSPALSLEWKGNPAWMMWPNRPLISVVELMHVPGFAANSFRPQSADAAAPGGDGMLANYAPPTGLAYLPSSLVLEAVRVPSRFAGTRLTIPDTAANADFLKNLESIGIYAPIVAVNQLDLGREPGRVNINTISSDAVWSAVVGGTHAGSTIPQRATANLTGIQPGTASTQPGSVSEKKAQPAQTLLNVVAVTGSAATSAFQNQVADIPDAASNPLHAMHTASRLANTATNRSHLFAVWITLRTIEQTPSTSPPVRDQDTARYHRMFFIYDRSKPVAFQAGKDHNVRDGILLKRVLQ